MLKFIKNELYLQRRSIIGILIVLVLSLTAMSIGIYKIAVQVDVNNLDEIAASFRMPTIWMLVGILAFFGAIFTSFIKIVKSFIDEFDSDKGYLTFSLPLTSYEIVLGKTLTAIIWYALNVLVTSIFFIIAFNFMPANIKESSNILKMIDKNIILNALLWLTSTFVGIITVFFSIALTKTVFKHKKIGKMWIIVFIMISVLFGFIVSMLSSIYPVYYNVNTGEFIRNIDTAVELFVGSGQNNFKITDNGTTYIHLSGLITSIFIMTGLYFGTAYLIDKKIEL